MSSGIKVLVFISVFCLNIGHVQGKIQTHVSTVYFDGILIYFPVRRSMLQARLDEINNRSADDDAKFFLPPEGTVFTDLLTRDQHVVMVVSGNSVATSFEEVLTYAQKESFSTRSNTLNFVFPLLTSSSGGLPELTLVLSRFTSTKTNFVDPNFALTTKILADDFEYTSNRSHIGISFTHDKTMKLKISGEVSELCRRHADIAGKDFMSINDELQISQQPPDFSVCDLLGNIDVDYCNAFRSYTLKTKE